VIVKDQTLSNTGFWFYVWMLLRLRLVIAFSSFKRAKTSRKIGYIILFIFIIGVVVAILVGTWGFLRLINSQELVKIIQKQEGMNQLLDFLGNLPIFVTTLAFILFFITGFGVMLQALYLSGDMDFLVVKPIPLRAVFLAKLLQAILPNFSLVLLLGIPVLFGLGFAWKYQFLYYPMTIIILAALALAASGLASLFVMFVVRIFPARRVAEVLGFVGAMISLICSQSGQIMRYENLSGAQTLQLLGLAQKINQPFSPLAWAGRGLVALGESNWLLALGYLSLTLCLTGVIFAVSLFSAEKLYYSGWASLQGISTRKRGNRKRNNSVKQDHPVDSLKLDTVPNHRASNYQVISSRILPVQIRSLMVKDFIVLRRDLRNLSQLVTPLIFGIIYGFWIFRDRSNPLGGSGQAPESILQGLKAFSVYFSVLISLFVSWSLLSRLAGMAFSQEGRNYWFIKTSPVKAMDLIFAKYLVAYLPTFTLSGIYLLAISLLNRNSFNLLPFTLPAIALIIAGNCGLNLAFGAYGARLDWQDPRQMQHFGASCLGSVITFAYLPFSVFLFFGPPILAEFLKIPQIFGQLIGLVIGGIFSLGLCFFSLILIKDKVARLGDL
jgi:ABC-2 type transport system permease protein